MADPEETGYWGTRERPERDAEPPIGPSDSGIYDEDELVTGDVTDDDENEKDFDDEAENDE